MVFTKIPMGKETLPDIQSCLKWAGTNVLACANSVSLIGQASVQTNYIRDRFQATIYTLAKLFYHAELGFIVRV